MEKPSTKTGIDQSLRGRIVDSARALFYDHGYSKVSTSEIAEAVGISKKTLYKEFETKEDILRACVIPKLKESAKLVDSLIADRSIPFPEKMKQVMSVIGFQHQRVSPVLLKDVSIHAPDLWREIVEHKQARFKKFGLLLDEGIEHGVFRDDIPREIILRCYTSAAENLMTPQSLGELPCTSQEVFQNIITILFEGILRDGKRKSLVSNKSRTPSSKKFHDIKKLKTKPSFSKPK
jgi:AcrR family transcriptional regulator